MRDEKVVDAELYAYENEVLEEQVMTYLKGGSDLLLMYWAVCRNDGNPDMRLMHFQDRRLRFPTLFQLAMDTLPVQGSAVACERVFSSAKRTVTDARNRLLPLSVEVRQILKFSLKNERLTLQARWGTTLLEASTGTIADELEEALKARDLKVIEALISEVELY